MPPLTFRTAGESHGPAVIAIIENMPAGLAIDTDFVNAELARRQGGYGRGGRMRIESDSAEFLAGIRLGRTMGGPIVVRIVNKDSRLDDLERTPPVHRPRPGHVDLAGSIKWLTNDARNPLERASARETAGRVAVGAIAACLLGEFEIEVFGFVSGMMDVTTDIAINRETLDIMKIARDASEVYCPAKQSSQAIIDHIKQTKREKDTVGGFCNVHVLNCPIGLGSCVQWCDKLDARLACAVMSIQAFKAVEIGLGTEVGKRRGSDVHDPIAFDASQIDHANLGYTRPSNNAGGLEGGMTNGQPIVVRGTMKPISTLMQGMPSVNMQTKEPEQSAYERSDVCALPAASVVMQNAVAFEVARAFLDKFGGDTMTELHANYETFLELARELG